jgi:hypothetical protein
MLTNTHPFFGDARIRGEIMRALSKDSEPLIELEMRVFNRHLTLPFACLWPPPIIPRRTDAGYHSQA